MVYYYLPHNRYCLGTEGAANVCASDSNAVIQTCVCVRHPVHDHLVLVVDDLVDGDARVVEPTLADVEEVTELGTVLEAITKPFGEKSLE